MSFTAFARRAMRAAQHRVVARLREREVPEPQGVGNDYSALVRETLDRGAHQSEHALTLCVHSGVLSGSRLGGYPDGLLSVRAASEGPAGLLRDLRALAASPMGRVVVIADARARPAEGFLARIARWFGPVGGERVVCGRVGSEPSALSSYTHHLPHELADAPVFAVRTGAAFSAAIQALASTGSNQLDDPLELQVALARHLVNRGAYVVVEPDCAEVATKRRAFTNYAPPLVSVYMPARNAATTIERAIASALAQSHGAIEVCVCDDGSTDATVARLEGMKGESRVLWRSIPARGIGAATNTAIAMARGDYILQLDADDELLPDAASTLVASLARDQGASLVYGSCELLDEAGAHQRYLMAERYSRYAHLTRNIVRPPRLFRARDFHRAGGCDESLLNAVDYDLSLKLSEVGRVRSVQRVLYRYYMHERGTSTANARAQEQNRRSVVAASLARRGLAWDILPDDRPRPYALEFVSRGRT